MIIRQTKSSFAPRNGGFSMIDVLVAIIVLATGLLALAALQGALTRNSADSKARSQIAAYAEGLIDQMRSSGTIASATISASNGSTATTQQKEAYYAQNAAGVSNLKTAITVTTYYGSTSGTGGSFSTTKPSNYNSSVTPRYDHVNVAATWTDPTGQARTLKFDTLVSPVTINTSNNSLDSQSLSLSGSTSPTVREYNPAATAGVIPIAVGTSQQSAATNPKPEVISTGGSTTAVVGTSFNVLTYNNPDSDNNTVITQRVDTLVISCSCKYGGAVTTDTNTGLFALLAQPYRPTYWDGTQYVEPTATTATSSATGVDTTVTQSPYCDVCCRDHNDASTDTVKFDPWNTTSGRYDHYRYDSSTSSWVVVPSTDTTNSFLNACRLIRVGGTYDVATDLNDYFFGLLATSTPDPASDAATTPIPDTTDTADFGTGGAVAQYQAFVKDYLETNISDLESNTIPSVSTTAATYGGSTYNLDVPDNIGIYYDFLSTDYRYLHSRGLYVDYLEPDAITAIDNAITNCTSSTVSDCYLPILPFTTVNLTEVSKWTISSSTGGCTSPDTSVTVNNQAIIGDTFNATRGVVTASSCAQTDDTATVQAKIADSNSGIAATGTDYANPVDPDDESHSQSDTQDFTVAVGSSTGPKVVAYVDLLPARTSNVLPQQNVGYQSTYPSISWQLDSTTAPSGSLTACSAESSGTGNSTQLNDYWCPSITTTTQTPTGVTITVKLTNYDYAYTATGTNPCDTSTTTKVQYCANYGVDTSNLWVDGTAVSSGDVSVAVTNDGNVGNSTLGTTAEMSVVTMQNQSLVYVNTIGVGFTLESTTSPSYTCNTQNKPNFASCN